MRPILKWPGGKAQLLPRLRPLVPHDIPGRYIEPFCGGAAVFFDRRPSRAVLSDVNHDLIATYSAVRDDVESVIKALKQHVWCDETHYLAIRDLDPSELEKLSPAERAARFVFLNRSGFNGLQRQNSKGENNVGFGKPRPWTPLDDQRLRHCSGALKHAELSAQDFGQTLGQAELGDFAFIDPPYVGGFANYTAGGFTFDDWRHLAELSRDLTDRGVELLITSSDVPEIRELFSQEPWRIDELRVRRNLAADKSARKAVTELAIRNFEPRKPAWQVVHEELQALHPSNAQNSQSEPPNLQTDQKVVLPARRGGRLTEQAVKERLEFVDGLLKSGLSRPNIQKAFRQKFGDVSARCVDEYLQRVKDKWAVDSASLPSLAEGRERERSNFIVKLEADIAEAKLSGVWNAVAVLRKLEASVRGIVQAPAPDPSSPPAPSVHVHGNALVVSEQAPANDAHRAQLFELAARRLREKSNGAGALVQAEGTEIKPEM